MKTALEILIETAEKYVYELENTDEEYNAEEITKVLQALAEIQQHEIILKKDQSHSIFYFRMREQVYSVCYAGIIDVAQRIFEMRHPNIDTIDVADCIAFGGERLGVVEPRDDY